MQWNARLLSFLVASFFALTAYSAGAILQQDPSAVRLYSLADREAQYGALAAMSAVEVKYRKHGLVRDIEGSTQLRLPGTLKLQPGDRAVSLLQALRPILLAGGSESLVVRQSVKEPYGPGHFVWADQYIDDIPVIDGNVKVILDSDGQIVKIVSSFAPKGKARTRASITSQGAKEKAKEHFQRQVGVDAGSVQLGSEATLAYWSEGGEQETPILLWMMDVYLAIRGEPEAFTIGVDATTGEVRYSRKALFGLNRTVYSSQNLSNLNPPVMVHLWDEGQPGTDIQGLAVYNGVLNPHQTWSGAYVSRPQAVKLSVHHGHRSSSYAIFSASGRIMLFGDETAMDPDAIAHEYGHHNYIGWMPEPVGLSLRESWDDWYAGNEFVADFSAVMTEIEQSGGAITASTWDISGHRNWENPKSRHTNYGDWYPSRLFRSVSQGTGYANSTIFGHGIYLMVNGGLHRRAGLPGLSTTIPYHHVPPSPWHTIKAVMMRGLFLMTLNGEPFTGSRLKQRTLDAAVDLYGPNSPVYTTVHSGWTAVGIDISCAAPPQASPNFLVSSWYCKGTHDVSWPIIPGVDIKYHAMAVQDPHGWPSYGATTVVDGNYTSCQLNVPPGAATRYRMRTCNACGCSGWSEDQWMWYYKPCL